MQKARTFVLYGGLLGLLASGPAYSGIIDTFADGVTDTTLWTVAVTGTGPTIAEQNGRLEISFPAYSADDTAGGFGAGYASRCSFRGDFDVQVSFQLLDWPYANGVRIGIGVGGLAASARVSLGSASDYPGVPRDFYVLNVVNYKITFLPTLHSEGTLRLVRASSVWSGYYLDAGNWVLMDSSVGPTGPMAVEVWAWSADYAFTDQRVRVAFTDFAINQDADCFGPVPTKSTTWGRLKSLYR